MILKNIDGMGLVILMSHLIITLALLGVYSYTLFIGQADETLKTIMTVVVGYWFGSMGITAVKSNDKEEKK